MADELVAPPLRRAFQIGSAVGLGEASTIATRLPASSQSQTHRSRLSVIGSPVAKASYESAVPANARTRCPDFSGEPAAEWMDAENREGSIA